MRYLIDSNIFIFYVVDRGELTKEVREIFQDYGNRI